MKKLTTIALAIAALIAAPLSAQAHCDSVDGPVASAALAALDAGNVNTVLPFVAPRAEAELTAAFEMARKARGAGPDAKSLADRYFMEAAVRLHRLGEGASYTGLKPAGRDLGPAIPAAEAALAAGRLDPVRDLIAHETERGLELRFAHALDAASEASAPSTAADVPAARERVHAELGFVQYVEGLHQATQAAAHTE